MYCSNCGNVLQEGSNFCPKCGTPSAASRPAQAPLPAGTQEPGHGALILVLGILSLVMLGPITGIPAWVVGVRDLRKIREGKIPASEQTMTQIGMVLGIVGTVLGAIALAIIVVSLLIVFGILTTVAGGDHENVGAFLMLLPFLLPGRRVRS
jgi:hypothetical protein